MEPAHIQRKTLIIVTIAKYEITKLLMLKSTIQMQSPVIVNEGAQIYGNFEKRLTKYIYALPLSKF